MTAQVINHPNRYAQPRRDEQAMTYRALLHRDVVPIRSVPSETQRNPQPDGAA